MFNGSKYQKNRYCANLSESESTETEKKSFLRKNVAINAEVEPKGPRSG